MANEDWLPILPKEIISIHLGQAGVQMSQAVWELYTGEHAIHTDGKKKMNRESTTVADNNDFAIKTMFEYCNKGNLTPRSLLVDLEPTVVDEIRTGSYRELFNHDRILNTCEDASNNYARGYHSAGKLILYPLEKAIRLSVEECDNLICFMTYRALGGGTGSGLCSLMLDVLHDMYEKKTKCNLSIYPSERNGGAILEPYNTVLTCHDSIEHVDVELLFDNESLYRFCDKRLSCPNPNYHYINQIIAQCSSMSTSCNRYRNFLYNDLHTLLTNLVPYPRIHFNLCAISPFTTKSFSDHDANSVINSTRALFRGGYQLFNTNLKEGKFLSCCLVYRGSCNMKDIYKCLNTLKAEKDIGFVDWIPNAFKVGVCPDPQVVMEGGLIWPCKASMCMIYSNTSIKDSILNITRQFQLLYKKKSFVFWYLGEGLEEPEFDLALQDVLSIVEDYTEVEKPSLDGGEPGGELAEDGQTTEQPKGANSEDQAEDAA